MDLAGQYEAIVSGFPVISSFVKFAILATTGEIIACRIRTKRWPGKEFGILPKAFIWGLLGVLILFAFRIFSKGVPQLCGSLLPVTSSDVLNLVLTAFYISLFMNCIFAPVMMLIHRLLDIRIEEGKGKMSSLLKSRLSVDELFRLVSWERMWGFVFKKTIPFFWIPAHTITFLLPAEWRILFAAALSVALGILLAFGSEETADTECQ